jgi:iron only hydrogenase large subunit-like protein
MALAGESRDVDHVMTTAELGKIFMEKGINVKELPESDFDCLVGEGTGGAVLFGTTGGVMEAALRTVYEQVRLLRGAALLKSAR